MPFSSTLSNFYAMNWLSLLSVGMLSTLAYSANLPPAIVQVMSAPIPTTGLTFPLNESSTAINVTAWDGLDIQCLRGFDDPPAQYEQCEPAATFISQSRQRKTFANRYSSQQSKDAIPMPINYFNSMFPTEEWSLPFSTKSFPLKRSSESLLQLLFMHLHRIASLSLQGYILHDKLRYPA